MTRSESDRLLDLTLRGIKQTVFFALPSYDITGSAIPVPGDLSMVTDFYGHPKCVIMTKRVSRVRFADVTREACGRDGNYPDLYAWRSAHSDLFTAEGAALGYCFTTDMKVLVEEFSVVYR
ncbi:MAG: ASCH domain-containing protein [Clostridia bacterium]|nr:ASCH domain-containing protein [Clostridia bacterium]